jgi:hypothetical protein
MGGGGRQQAAILYYFEAVERLLNFLVISGEVFAGGQLLNVAPVVGRTSVKQTEKDRNLLTG